MEERTLFLAQHGEKVTSSNLLRALEAVGVPQSAILFMHTELSFGMPNPELGKQGLLEALYQVLCELDISNLCVPTYTFSFCNMESYDVQKSRSRMGALNEYLRQLPDARRSMDPLLSVALLGDCTELVTDLSFESIGPGSTFDKIHQANGVQFLFLGARLSRCFTYLHYVERRQNVPYRYNRPFAGTITAQEQCTEAMNILFVRYQGVHPTSETKFEDLLLSRGLLRQVSCGDGSISCIDEQPAYAAVCEMLEKNSYYFLDPPYPAGKLGMEFTVQERMVAL